MRRLSFVIVAFVIWVLVTWSLSWQELTIGLVVVLFTSLLFGESFPGFKIFSPKRIGWLIYYIPVWIFACILANLDVAYRAIHPKMPIKPGIVKIRTSLKSDIGKTVLANSITMTPGTMTVDINGEYLYIHWIWVGDEKIEEATRIIAERFERILKHIFE
ncbi:MAG: Na+/H+ antiporter subunit E [bacterium]|nr:Na+/H+ antiporter subunit E [bacterium]